MRKMLFKVTNNGVSTAAQDETFLHLIEKNEFVSKRLSVSMLSHHKPGARVTPASLLTRSLPQPFDKNLVNEPVFFLFEGEDGKKVVSAKQCEKMLDLLIAEAPTPLQTKIRGRGLAMSMHTRSPSNTTLAETQDSDEEEETVDTFSVEDMTKSDCISFCDEYGRFDEEEDDDDEVEDAEADVNSRIEEEEDEEEAGESVAV